jgi:hypothetical protein
MSKLCVQSFALCLECAEPLAGERATQMVIRKRPG